MRHGLPLWCCLDNKSKLALVDMLQLLGETEFNEPLPIWKEYTPKKKRQATSNDIDYGKFMRQRPRHPKQVK